MAPLRKSGLYGAAVVLSLLQPAFAQTNGTSEGNLNFHLTTGGFENYFLRDNITTAQLLLTSANGGENITTESGFVPPNARRLVIAMPAGNSGALTYFLPLADNETISPTLVNGTYESTTDPYDNVGVQADLSFDGNATLGFTSIGAVRAMRGKSSSVFIHYVEGSGLIDTIFNYTLGAYNDTSVQLHRRWINATANGTYLTADFFLNTKNGTTLSVTPTTSNVSTEPPTVNIFIPQGGNGTVQVRFVTNETTIPGSTTEALFLQNGSTPAINTALVGLANGSDPNAQQVDFLTYQPKFTAGGWRFLTYFGRDTMIATRLLMPLMTSEAIETVLGAVIERVNTTGALCHEETIGDYASYVNIMNNQSYLGGQPWYNYLMIDVDLYLLPVMAHYFLDLPQGQNRSAQFLARNATLQTGTYAELLNRTVQYNLGRAAPFAAEPNYTNLLHFRPGQPVGDWRDSNQGTGYGPIPFDVNTALVPANLRATAALAQAGIIDANATTASAAADVWESMALPFYEVTMDNVTADSRMENFVQAANLSTSLLDSATANATSSGTNGTGNTTFYALSLMDDGSPVEVLHSDLCFNLVFGSNVTKDYLQRVVDALQPYPRGLLTNIGMLVANPGYDSNTTNIEVLNTGAYHGTVVWSFQQGLMAGGLARQLGYCGNNTDEVDINPALATTPEWCSDEAFVQSVRDAQTRLWTSIKGGVSEIFTETWSYTYDNTTEVFSPADLAVLSPQGTESDAIQLWSFGFLALLDPATNQTITNSV